MSKVRNSLSILAIAAVASVGIVIGASSASADPVTRVTICHRTNSDSNPYVEITPDVDGVLDGHAKKHDDPFVWTPDLKAEHQKWGDIIPPFDYIDKNGDLQHFPGLNMDTLGGLDGKTSGADILANDCQIPNDPPVVEHGNLTVTKDVSGDDGGASFKIAVDCDDDSVHDVATLSAGQSKSYDNLVAGITCTVSETDNGGATSTVYAPVGVDSDGIEIVADTDNAVTVTNNFSPTPTTPTTPSGPTVSPETVTAPVVAPAAVIAAPQFTG